MRPLTDKNIEAELSYAYLHAVVSKAGAACREANRVEDGNGIDAILTAWGPFEGARYRSEVSLNVQLKATTATPRDTGTHLSYYVAGESRVHDLRDEGVVVPRILVVLFLPSDASQWLEHKEEGLVLRRCAYWVSLRGSPLPTSGGSPIYLPKGQMFSPESLRDLAHNVAREQIPRYEEPVL